MYIGGEGEARLGDVVTAKNFTGETRLGNVPIEKILALAKKKF